MRVVWIQSMLGAEAQLWDDDYRPMEPAKIIQDQKVHHIHRAENLDRLKKLYPLRPRKDAASSQKNNTS